MKAEAVGKRTKEFSDRAAEVRMERTKSDPEEGEYRQATTTQRMAEGSENSPNQSSSRSIIAGTGED